MTASEGRANEKRTFTFMSEPTAEDGEDQDDDYNASILLNTLQPTQYIRLDLVPYDTSFVPTTYGYDTSITFNNTHPSIDIATHDNFNGVPSYGSVISIIGGYNKPINTYTWIGRGWGIDHIILQYRTLALDNSTLNVTANGDYRILVRVLKWGSELTDPSGYEFWLSPVIGVNITDYGIPNPGLELYFNIDADIKEWVVS
jgi:hypothetical protein